MKELISSLINMHYLRLKQILPSTVFIFYLVIPFVNSSFYNISFSFPPFDSSTMNLNNASVQSSGIALATIQPGESFNGIVGQSVYYQPMHLWDNGTGNVADFTTQFTFIIDSHKSSSHADGLAFFLAPTGFHIPENSGGVSLGLTNPTQTTTNSSTAFVAVEFNTYCSCMGNTLGPHCDHVGIDVMSVASVTYECNNWMGENIYYGQELHTIVTYNSSTSNLSVLFEDNANHSTSLYYQISLTDYLPEWVIFGFTAATGSSYESHEITSWEFSSTLQVPDQFSPAAAPSSEKNLFLNKSKSRKHIILGVGLGSGCFGLILVASGFTWFYRRSSKNRFQASATGYDVPSMDEEFQQVIGPKKFSYKDIMVATNNFANEQLLGQGGSGRVYEGFLPEINSRVVIKRIAPESEQEIKECATEVKTISKLRHRNLVQLIGWCHEKNEFLLMYEYMPNGSLDVHLFKGKSFLTWETRYKIAEGIASALLYLHNGWERCVVHGDIKCSNIMLDSEFNAKVGDFSLGRPIDRKKGSQTTVMAEMRGYMAPECFNTGKASKESDIYSFGIVLLEIVCGRKAVEPSASEDQVQLSTWVWQLHVTGKLLDAADPKLDGCYNEKQMEQLMTVGLWCSLPDKTARPSIVEAMNVLLNVDAAPPILPSEMPISSNLSLRRMSPTSSSFTAT